MLDNDNNIPKKSPQSSGRSASNRTISIRQQGIHSSRAEQESCTAPRR